MNDENDPQTEKKNVQKTNHHTIKKRRYNLFLTSYVECYEVVEMSSILLWDVSIGMYYTLNLK